MSYAYQNKSHVPTLYEPLLGYELEAGGEMAVLCILGEALIFLPISNSQQPPQNGNRSIPFERVDKRKLFEKLTPELLESICI